MSVLSYIITEKPRKAKKSFFVAKKSMSVLKLLRVFIDGVAFRFYTDRVFSRFLIDRILLRVLIFRVLFKCLVKSFSSGSAKINYSLGSSVVFFRHAAIFLSNRTTAFFQKLVFYFTLYFQKEIRSYQLV